VIDKAHPLYKVLSPLGREFMFADWRDLSQGQYAKLAERLRRSRQTQGYAAGLIQGSSAAFVFYWLSEYGRTTETYFEAYFMVMAIISAATAVGSLLRWRKQRRVYDAAISSLQSGCPS